MFEIELTPEQEVEAAKLEAQLLERARGEVRRMARLLASRPTEQLFGQTEFDLRDGCHRIGAAALETALQERKKGGIEDRAASTRKPRSRRGSSDTATGRR